MTTDEHAELWQPPPWREVFRGHLGALTVGLLLLEVLIAVQVLIVATIMPAIETDIGGLRLYGWVFSGFSLATFGMIPIAGRAADRYGPRRPLALCLAVYLVGLVIAALAPSMPVLIGARFIQGAGAGGMYALELGVVVKAFPERLRPRVLALLASMWILPGLLGPPLGALIASTIGWRWAFVAGIPVLVVATALVFPALGGTQAAGGGNGSGGLPVRWPLQLTIGAGLFLAALTDTSLWSIPLAAAGLAIGLPALARIVPAGSFTARPGLPATAAAAFLLSAGFFAVDGFIPLMFTQLRGLTVAQASIVLTIATVTWSLGSLWQSRHAGRYAPRTFVLLGSAAIGAGTAAVATGLLAIPIAVAYAGWGLAGLGMGIAFPTIPLTAMTEAGEGSESGELSSVLLMDTLGVAIGAGLGGSCIAIAHETGAGLRVGLTGAFVVGIVGVALLGLAARHLPADAPTARG